MTLSLDMIASGVIHNILNGAGCLFLFIAICSYLKYRGSK